MGDIVLTSPVIRVLKRQTRAEIHYLTKGAFQSLISENPNVDKLWILEKGETVTSLAQRLKPENFDLIIDLHNNLRSISLSKLLRIKSFRFRKLNIEKWLFVNLKWNRLPDIHIVDRYMETLAPLGVVNDGGGLDFFISKGEIFPIKKPEFDRFAVFAVGAAHATKQVPVSQVIPLLNHVSAPIVLIGGPGDVDRAAQIEKGVCGPILNLTGQMSIQESASVIDQADFAMVPDTGMMHISAALKKPIVLFWGSTSEEFGMFPYFGHRDIPVLNVKVNGLKCRPCTKYGKSKCPRGHFKCMLQWNPMEVAEEINSFSEHIQRKLAIH
ncbi:MAG: glycosyl transferase [Bacteroidetes bacterium]|jgi:heptosyltransferase-2|nr:glycosyl transferase [Bacteroidota bacterium]